MIRDKNTAAKSKEEKNCYRLKKNESLLILAKW
jgi:hypothetical protein